MKDKNSLDDMAKKYKEEMMRLYSSKRSSPAHMTEHKPEKAATKSSSPAMESEKIPPQPPMPEIPMNYGTGTEVAENTPPKKFHTEKRLEKSEIIPSASKFPSADEIMQAEMAVPAVATISSEPRYEPAEDYPHNQGNYSYDAPEALEDLEDYVEDIIPEVDYPDNNTEFEDLFDDDDDYEENPPDMEGTGYLQAEVTSGDGAIPIRGAAVIVTQEINGQSYLVTMKLTDGSGTTEVIPLPAPSASFSEAPDPSERPFSEYNVAVYKKGFYTVPEVTVPIFDTIKSIQPVSLIPLAENDLQGYRTPNGGGSNG